MRFLSIPMTLIAAFWMQGAALAQEAPAEQQAQDAEPAAAEPSGDTQAGDPQAGDAQAGDPQAADAAGAQDLLSEAQLEQLAAPIALYPDPLLSEVLIASTYPLEVVQAERWAEKNKDIKGEALDTALNEQDWDDSIKSLVEVPDVLAMMNKDLDWTQDLGNAVLAQQADLMEAIQSLRTRAQDNGQLESNPQQTVNVTQEVTQGGEEKQVIVIQPTQPDTVYVPYYQPQVVYGSWPYPSYQPYYFPPPPGYAFGGALARGFAWSAGFAVGNAIWGNGFNWGRNDINVNVNRNFNSNVNINNNNVNVQSWKHNSYHRRGVEYNNTNVKNKFSNNKNNIANRGDNIGNRRPGDNRPGQGGLGDKRPGQGGLGDKRPGQGGLGDKRPGGGNLAGNKRPTVGDMESALKKKPGGGQGANLGGGNRPSAGGGGNRPSAGGGNRPSTKDMQSALKKPSAGNKANLGNKKPSAAKRPQAKPQAKRPSGNAFQKRDGGKTRNASNRGKKSVGNRSAKSMSKRKPQSRKRPSGGHRASGGRSRGGGGGRGGGRRR